MIVDSGTLQAAPRTLFRPLARHHRHDHSRLGGVTSSKCTSSANQRLELDNRLGTPSRLLERLIERYEPASPIDQEIALACGLTSTSHLFEGLYREHFGNTPG